MASSSGDQTKIGEPNDEEDKVKRTKEKLHIYKKLNVNTNGVTKQVLVPIDILDISKEQTVFPTSVTNKSSDTIVVNIDKSDSHRKLILVPQKKVIPIHPQQSLLKKQYKSHSTNTNTRQTIEELPQTASKPRAMLKWKDGRCSYLYNRIYQNSTREEQKNVIPVESEIPSVPKAQSSNIETPESDALETLKASVESEKSEKICPELCSKAVGDRTRKSPIEIYPSEEGLSHDPIQIEPPEENGMNTFIGTEKDQDIDEDTRHKEEHSYSSCIKEEKQDNDMQRKDEYENQDTSAKSYLEMDIRSDMNLKIGSVFSLKDNSNTQVDNHEPLNTQKDEANRTALFSYLIGADTGVNPQQVETKYNDGVDESTSTNKVNFKNSTDNLAAENNFVVLAEWNVAESHGGITPEESAQEKESGAPKRKKIKKAIDRKESSQITTSKDNTSIVDVANNRKRKTVKPDWSPKPVHEWLKLYPSLSRCRVYAPNLNIEGFKKVQTRHSKLPKKPTRNLKSNTHTSPLKKKTMNMKECYLSILPTYSPRNSHPWSVSLFDGFKPQHKQMHRPIILSHGKQTSVADNRPSSPVGQNKKKLLMFQMYGSKYLVTLPENMMSAGGQINVRFPNKPGGAIIKYNPTTNPSTITHISSRSAEDNPTNVQPKQFSMNEVLSSNSAIKFEQGKLVNNLPITDEKSPQNLEYIQIKSEPVTFGYGDDKYENDRPVAEKLQKTAADIKVAEARKIKIDTLKNRMREQEMAFEEMRNKREKEKIDIKDIDLV